MAGHPRGRSAGRARLAHAVRAARADRAGRPSCSPRSRRWPAAPPGWRPGSRIATNRGAPPDAGARFGHPRVAWRSSRTRLPRRAARHRGALRLRIPARSRPRARDPLLAALWRASSGAADGGRPVRSGAWCCGHRPDPAALPVVGRSRRATACWPRTSCAGRVPSSAEWTWHADETRSCAAVPIEPDQRRSIAQGHVRLLGTGPAPPRAARAGPQPRRRAPSSRIVPEWVELTCRSPRAATRCCSTRRAGRTRRSTASRPPSSPPIYLPAPLQSAPAAVSLRVRAPGLRLGGVLAAGPGLNAAGAGAAAAPDARSAAGQRGADRAGVIERAQQITGRARRRCGSIRPGRCRARPATPPASGSCRRARCPR